MSIKDKLRPKIFFGWWIVLFIGVITGLGSTLNTYGISVLFIPIASDLGLSRAAASWASGIGRLGGLTSPVAGLLADRFGPRWIVVFGLFLCSSGIILMYFITEAWHYYLAWGMMFGFGVSIGLQVAADKTISDWFVRRRGLAMGIKFGLIGVLGIVVIQIITPLLDLQGWRYTCLVCGLVLLGSVPIAYMLVKPRRPEYYGMLPDGGKVPTEGADGGADMLASGIQYASSVQEKDYSFRQAIRTRALWMLIIAIVIQSTIASGFSLHVHPFLTDRGMTEAVASMLLSISIFSTIPARFFGGWIVDRVPKNRLNYIVSLAFLIQVIGLSSFLLLQNTPSVYLMLICHGLSFGALTPLIILLVGRYFGRKAFGAIFGTLLACITPLGLLTPVYYGWIYDVTGNYNNAFFTVLLMAVLAVVITSLMRPPRPRTGIEPPVW